VPIIYLTSVPYERCNDGPRTDRIGSFIPILLESLARENGVLLSDRTTPCGSSSDKGADGGGQCVVYVLGFEINTASFAMYTFSISVLLQAILVVSISCAADHGNYRKKLLLAFAWIGSGSVMLYIFVSKSLYLLGALLAIVSNTSFGASFVLLNSFLPLLVRHHPEVSHVEETATRTSNGEQNLADSTAALLPHRGSLDQDGQLPALSRVQTREELTSQELNLSTRISSKGIGIGYIAGVSLQCIAIFMLIQMKNTTWGQRVVLFVVGAWWAVFTIPAALWLRPRPGPPLPAVSSSSGEKMTGVRALVAYTVYAWKSLFRTVQLARRLIDIVLFLGGWFLLSDAVATTSSTAILFAKTQLHMEPWALGLINVISTAAGIAGAFSWSIISRRFRLQAHQTILACIALFEIIPIYGLMGYLPFVRNWGVLGLQQPWEMYPLAAVYGFVLGGLSGYCRSLYGELIPPGSEAAFYALYAITDKGSSVFGPASVGAIIDASGEIRPAFWFLAALVGLPAPLIWAIDVERGRSEGEKLAEVIEGFRVVSNGGSGRESDDENRAILDAYDEETDR
jgi:UMF1 family MFS transporter